MTAAGELTRQSVTAVKWSAAGTAARYVLQIAAQVVLARLLGPDAFGVFALGLIVFTFCAFLADFGFAFALIQAEKLTDEDIRFAFTWQVITGSVAALILFSAAPAAAAFFAEPRAEPIIRWLSLACVLNAAGATTNNLMKRSLDSQALNIVQVASCCIGYLAVGVPLAYQGAGVWALVAAWLTQAACIVALGFIRCPIPLKPLLSYRRASEMTGVGVTAFITKLTNWFLDNLDRAVLGRVLDAHAVGLFAMGKTLATAPGIFLEGVHNAFFAAGARTQTEPRRLRAAYLSVLATTWILIAPLFILLAVVAQDFTALVFGAAWNRSGTVLAIVALGMPAYVTFGMSTPVLWNTGRRRLESLLQWPILIAAGVALYSFAAFGVEVAAIVVAVIFLARGAVTAIVACRALDIHLRDTFGFAVRAAVTCALTGAAAGAGAAFSRALGAGEVYGLVASILLASTVVPIAVYAYPNLVGTTVIDLLGRFIPRLASALRR